MAPTATTVPVEQENSAARLEAAEQLPETLDPESLRKYFTLTETDLQEVAVCRGVVNKLGFAVQLCTLRWQGYFLGDTRGLPATVLETLARQLGLLAMSIDDYPQNEKTRWEHLERIRQHLRFQPCDDFQRQRLLKHLTETAQALPRSDALRQEAWRWLQEQRIVRPGRTTLRDLLTAAREGALQHAFALLARGLTAEQREQLDALLLVPSGDDVETQAGVVTEFWSRSGLEQYKALARKESPEALLSLLDRLTAILERGLATLPAIEAIHPATRRRPDKDENDNWLEKAKPKTLSEDIATEKAQPHVEYLLYDRDEETGEQFLDVNEMREEWRSIRHKKDATYRTLAKNCSTIVGRVLRAGGVENLVGRIKAISYSHNMYWTPKDVAQLCDQLVKRGYAEKENSFGKPGKWNAVTLIGLR